MGGCNSRNGAKSFDPVNKSNVDRFTVSIAKDGEPWNLATGSVTILFKTPNRSTVYERSMVASDASQGEFYYDTLTTDLTLVGSWLVGIRVIDGSVVKDYPYEISVQVVDRP